ncbi:hypothetical protein HK099_000848 [Clydaea vesicula]|uniref:Uncharacterized protein n=1 Tax=Clydaea vesicula TaxID=447962 RepID=A0AAD5XZX1_9FUNG|nr:hypothetical protein HK099_000848 [Clydaea vesicula]
MEIHFLDEQNCDNNLEVLRDTDDIEKRELKETILKILNRDDLLLMYSIKNNLTTTQSNIKLLKMLYGVEN